jgi:hypothetical protein
VKELRLAEINSIAAANELLAAGYGEQLSEKFAVAPRATADYHRAPKGYDLAAIFCLEEERSLLRDWTVRFENQFFQLEPPSKTMLARGKVLVQRYLDGSLHFRYQEQELRYTLLPERPQPTMKAAKRKPKTKAPGEGRNNKPVPPNHPWRNFIFGRGTPLQRS